MKIILNKCYGGFNLSAKAIEKYLLKKGKECYFYKQTAYKHSGGLDIYEKISVDKAEHFFITTYTKDMGQQFNEIDDEYCWYESSDILRVDKDCIDVVEELGKEANTRVSSLQVIEIPDDLKYEIDDYDGIESVHEIHRSW